MDFVGSHMYYAFHRDKDIIRKWIARMTKHKYSDKHKDIHKTHADCPPLNAIESERMAYRWVKNPISEDCFLPQAIRNPSKLHNATKPEMRCSCWGLSFHDSLESSMRVFRGISKTAPMFRKHVGGWVAEGKIKKTDGVCTPASNHGHFDLHEYNSVELQSSFHISEEIPD